MFQPSAIGENLKRLREAQGLSQEALATRAGTTQSRVQAIESGKTAYPRANTVHALAKALGVDVSALTGEPMGLAEDAAEYVNDYNRDLVFRLAPGAGQPTAFKVAADMPAFGLLRGDVAVIDMEAEPTRDALVVAELVNEATGSTETAIRRYLPPVLVSADGHSVVEISADTVAQMHPVVAVFRAPLLE